MTPLAAVLPSFAMVAPLPALQGLAQQTLPVAAARAAPLDRPVRCLRVVALLLLGSCVFPTEKDESVHVSLTPISILFRGNDTVVTAAAWQMMSATDSQPITNAVFVWSSSDPNVATVDGSGRVVGINSGTTIVTAAIANFDKSARPATDTIRVAAPLEIDSARPKTVHYGEILTIYGVSVDSIFSTSLAGAGLIRVPFADTLFTNGTARSRWWVPPPAHTDSLFYLGITGGNGVLGYFRGDTTNVIEQDLFEPNDTVPTVLDLDAPPPFPQIPQIAFANPALAFEPVARGTGTDWYRMTHAGTRDLTVILTAPQVKGTYTAFITDSLAFNQGTGKFTIGSNSWSFGPSSHFCRGASFAPGEALGDSVIAAFKALPPGSLDALAAYGVAGRYGLTVLSGYQSELPPDKHEDDNSCNAADLRGPAILPYRDTLAIENPHDIDWILFSVAAGANYRFRLHALPGTGTKPDSAKDFDLYVVRQPTPGQASVQVMSADAVAGSDVNRVVSLSIGNYYMVVVDFAGATSTYEVCAARDGGGACQTGWPVPPVLETSPRRVTTMRQPSSVLEGGRR